MTRAWNRIDRRDYFVDTEPGKAPGKGIDLWRRSRNYGNPGPCCVWRDLFCDVRWTVSVRFEVDYRRHDYPTAAAPRTWQGEVRVSRASDASQEISRRGYKTVQWHRRRLGRHRRAGR